MSIVHKRIVVYSWLIDLLRSHGNLCAVLLHLLAFSPLHHRHQTAALSLGHAGLLLTLFLFRSWLAFKLQSKAVWLSRSVIISLFTLSIRGFQLTPVVPPRSPALPHSPAAMPSSANHAKRPRESPNQYEIKILQNYNVHREKGECERDKKGPPPLISKDIVYSCSLSPWRREIPNAPSWRRDWVGERRNWLSEALIQLIVHLVVCTPRKVIEKYIWNVCEERSNCMKTPCKQHTHQQVRSDEHAVWTLDSFVHCSGCWDIYIHRQTHIYTVI